MVVVVHDVTSAVVDSPGELVPDDGDAMNM